MNLRALEDIFKAHFQRSPEAAFFAPGRVSLMGEHTDYNQGLVLGAAINLGTYLIVAAREDDTINLIATAFPDEPRQWLSSPLIPQDNEFDWSNYLRSLNENLVMQFGAIKGMDVAIGGDLPIGAGLSSSFSLLIAFAEAVNQLNTLGLTAQAIAELCLHTKQQLSSVVGQLSEPLTIATGRPQHFLLVDCRSHHVTQVPLPKDVSLLIINPQQPKGFVSSAFLQRKNQCETAAKALGLASLRDLSKRDLLLAKETLDEVVFRRALHVVSENSRCIKAAAHLLQHELADISQVLAESQRSLREDMDVTTESIDFIAAEIQNVVGNQGGVHLTGGGFGGSLLVLVERSLVDAVKAKVATLPRKAITPKPEVLEITAVAGVRRVDLPAA